MTEFGLSDTKKGTNFYDNPRDC